MDPHSVFVHKLTHSPRMATDSISQNEGESSLENLYPALVECFGIIILGYLAGKLSLINDVEAKGLGVFVGKFSLPALIFVSLCQLNLTSVNWTFLAAVSIAKSVVFFSVFIIGAVSQGSHIDVAALCAIFCTQSNDFALGFPVLTALYANSHPEYPMYLYLLAPVSLAFLNPIGFVIIEIVKNKNENENKSGWKIFKKVSKSILTNPLIVMTVLGILGNLIFHSAMPSIIHEFMKTLGSAFSGSALFLLGLRMVSQSDGQSKKGGYKSLLITMLLITIKSLVLPLITREIVSQMDAGADSNTTDALSNYGFLYGTIPTAPSVFVYATSYGLEPELFAGAITASTFVAAPLMYISAKMMMIKNMDPAEYTEEIDTFLLDVGAIGLIAAILVIFVLVITKKCYSMPHQMTAVISWFQVFACAGAVLWSFLDCSHGWKLYLQFIIWGYGVFGSRISTAILSFCLYLQSASTTSLAKWKKYIVGTALLFPLALVSALTLVVAIETGQPHSPKVDPNFQYGNTQAIVALVILVLSLIFTVIFIVLHQRNLVKTGQNNSRETDRLLQASPQSTPSRSPVPPDQTVGYSECGGPLGNCPVSRLVDVEDIVPAPASCQARGRTEEEEGTQEQEGAARNGRGKRYRCDSTHREYCSGLMRRYEVPHGEDALSPDNILSRNALEGGLLTAEDRDADPLEITKHRILCIILCLSMFVGGALCIWTLCMESMSGIYLELVFIDGFMNLGQSIFTFALFAINAKNIEITIKSLLRRFFYGKEQLNLPHWEDLDAQDRDISARFIKHHIETCMEDILHDFRQNIRRHNAAFYGSELVEWLVEYGLAQSRQEAVKIGRSLLRGRVIRHVDNHIDFYDSKYVYTFLPENARLRSE